MKFHRQLLFALLILLIPFSLYSSDLGEVYLRFIGGDVQIRPVDTADWVSVPANTPLLEGDQIFIPEGGRAELAFRDGTLLRLDQNSALEIVSLQKDRLQVYLDVGHAYVNRVGSARTSFLLETPWLSLSTSRQSIFKADASEHGDVEIIVMNGQILARRDGREKVIKAGEGFVFLEGVTDPERIALLSPDGWEQWNMRRDENFYASGPSSRYLPDELQPYTADLDQYGTWVNTPDYGYVWAPIVVGGWSPYGYGRWARIRGDYIWIPYEPWGWIPHHYGRWIYRNPIGWGWVPPRKGLARWAPGYVGWSHTPTSVSWVPLAPRDTYYSHGYYGPGTANIATTSNSKGRPISLFRNARVNNAVTTVTTEAFLAGRAPSATASGPGEGFAQSTASRVREFHVHELRIGVRSATGFASAPVQVGDVLVWKSNEASGARTYLVSNLPQGPRRLNISPAAISNPVTDTVSPAPPVAGPGTPDAGRAGHAGAERITDRVAKLRGTGDLRKSTPEARAGQPSGRTEHLRSTPNQPVVAGSRQTGSGNTNAMTPRATGSSSSSGVSPRGGSRGSSRGRR